MSKNTDMRRKLMGERIKSRRRSIVESFKEKLGMYDMLLANILAKDTVFEPEGKLESGKIELGFNSVASETQMSKYYVITGLPGYINYNFYDSIRSECIMAGIKINFYSYVTPHRIAWESAEMRNKLDIWKRVIDKQQVSESAFDYREARGKNMTKTMLAASTLYFNKAELDYKRTLCKVMIAVEFVCVRGNDKATLNMAESIRRFKSLCARQEIKIKQIDINMLDWLRYLGIYSLKPNKEVQKSVIERVVTDDVLANLDSYRQGRIGENGICLGMDIHTSIPVLRKFKADPDAPENWLISAETGGGKSYFVKSLLTYLLADNFVVTVMDYEGDEYLNLAAYIKAGNPSDVRVVSMGKGSTEYFDPMEIASLTGDADIDCDLKETAQAYTVALFRVLIVGLTGALSKWQDRVVSGAIGQVYKAAGVTDDPDTWIRSTGLRIKMVYDEIKREIKSGELLDPATDNIKHKTAVEIAEGASVYFEEGEVKAGAFKNALSVNSLYGARFIIFSFGMKGATASQTDPIILALKQLSVANIAIQISNHCKYVKKCFNVKVWEEFQRWGEVEGSSDIIVNAMTGGRKRGDVNILITNDLNAILDTENKVSTTLRQNIQCKAIGKVDDSAVREKFCTWVGKPELRQELASLAKAHMTDDIAEQSGLTTYSTRNKYKHSFCLLLDNGKQAVVKVMLPTALRKSSLFKTGVDVSGKQGINGG